MIDKKINLIIESVVKHINIASLKETSIKSLVKFYNAQYNELLRSFGWQLAIMSAVFLLNNKTLEGLEIKPSGAEKERAIKALETAGYDRSRLMGSPLQKFTKEYISNNVKPALDRLAKQQAKDPDDVSARNTLRNKAEMEVRYKANLDMVDELKLKGIKLVVCSSHADCSERCAPWQGRVYSLDGTKGITDDGRSYRPLEDATDHYYTTKSGKTYKNGLLGFNCRHYLVPYKTGFRFPKPNVQKERKEYLITKTQRKLEREVRKWRIKTIEAKGVDSDTYRKAREKAITWNKRYIEYSKANNRAYYPSRTKLI